MRMRMRTMMSERPSEFPPEEFGFLLLGLWRYLPFSKFMQSAAQSTAHMWVLTDVLLEVARSDSVSFMKFILDTSRKSISQEQTFQQVSKCKKLFIRPDLSTAFIADHARSPPRATIMRARLTVLSASGLMSRHIWAVICRKNYPYKAALAELPRLTTGYIKVFPVSWTNKY